MRCANNFIATVIGGAVIPTLSANAFIDPRYLLPKKGEAQGDSLQMEATKEAE
jgi:hypothetical protein